jgi:hypothetical protein
MLSNYNNCEAYAYDIYSIIINNMNNSDYSYSTSGIYNYVDKYTTRNKLVIVFHDEEDDIFHDRLCINNIGISEQRLRSEIISQVELSDITIDRIVSYAYMMKKHYSREEIDMVLYWFLANMFIISKKEKTYQYESIARRNIENKSRKNITKIVGLHIFVLENNVRKRIHHEYNKVYKSILLRKHRYNNIKDLNV